ncbi:response regulator transcription factor [Bailinhaonella thermotolerans]|uniref:DNA-binding response regulator n=1 Tax=Bailinhaonella thermotolerans TaxID=1070861 RepID=A0A3A4A9T6_9ACTN|nr:response regulator transcription factor [Bailinhaonella thermotolerans]RJL22810.1 DNA-binding response regulator [Bailinhaonella thermotolerans]
MTIRVLIADDQELVRTGFKMILDAQPDMEVVASVADGAEAVEAARRLRPDVCLLDIRMPRLDGLEVTRALAGPGVPDPLRVVIVTTFDLDEYVYGALRSGACGFLLKDSGPTLLIEAVRAAAAGDALVSPSVTVRLLEHLAAPRAAAAAPDRQPREPLTERELDVVRLIARGRTNQEVAAELFVSLSTVKTHLGSIMGKLGARNRVEIAAWAWETGLVGK